MAVTLLNEDLQREYQAVIAHIVPGRDAGRHAESGEDVRVEAENTTVRNYRERILLCEALGWNAIALGKDVVDPTAAEELV